MVYSSSWQNRSFSATILQFTKTAFLIWITAPPTTAGPFQTQCLMALIFVISQCFSRSALLGLACALRSQSFPCRANFSTMVNCFGHSRHPLSCRIAGCAAISNKGVSSGRFLPPLTKDHWITIFELLKWFCKPNSVSNGQFSAALPTTGSLPTIRWFFFRLELVTYYVNPLDLSTAFLSQNHWYLSHKMLP